MDNDKVLYKSKTVAGSVLATFPVLLPALGMAQTQVPSNSMLPVLKYFVARKVHFTARMLLVALFVLLPISRA